MKWPKVQSSNDNKLLSGVIATHKLSIRAVAHYVQSCAAPAHMCEEAGPPVPALDE